MTFRYFLLTAAFFLSFILVGQEKIVITDPNFENKSMDDSFLYLEDAESKFTIDDILSGKYTAQFSKSDSIVKKELISNSTFWLKSTIENRSGQFQEYFLYLDDPSIYDVKLFYVSTNGELVKQIGGIGIPPSKRNYEGHITCFSIKIPNEESIVIYIRANAKNFITLPFSLHSLKSFTEKFLTERMFLGLFYGILISIIFYNLFLFLTTRKSYFLYYILYSIFFALITGTYDGLTSEYFYGYVKITGGYHDVFSIGLTNIFFMAFMLSFLKIRTIAPKFRIIVNAYILLTLIVFSITVVNPKLALLISTFMSLPTAIIIIYGGIIALRAKLSEAKFFMAAYLVFFIFIFIAVVTIIKIIPTNFFTFHSLHFGYFSNLLILSFGLGYKLTWGVKERQKLIEDTNKELERKVIERTREISAQNDELKKLNAEMDSFVYSTSHDLKAPLSSLLGLIKIMRIEEDDKKKEEYFGLMEKTILKQSNFINEIVDYSRNTRMEVESNEIEFESLINEIFESLEFTKAGTQVERSINIKLNGKFYSDQNRLKVILNNLISNAIRFANLGIKSKKVYVSVTSNGKNAIIEVHDTGPGITDEHLTKIFNMFYRASITQSGSGLGLYIVKETVDKLKGKVTAESKINESTTFRVSIPNLNPN